MCMCIPVCICMCVGAHEDQKRAFDPLEVESHEAVNSLMWVLGTQFRVSERASSTLSHGALSPSL